MTLSVSIRTLLVVGSGLGAVANFNWAATGAPALTVNIEVKSSVTFLTWLKVLSGQPPVDLASWPVSGQPGETFHFRAVAIDAQGNRVGTSPIVTI